MEVFTKGQTFIRTTRFETERVTVLSSGRWKTRFQSVKTFPNVDYTETTEETRKTESFARMMERYTPEETVDRG